MHDAAESISHGGSSNGRMGINLIPAKLRGRYLFEERHHATSILAIDFKKEFRNLAMCVEGFCLQKSHIPLPAVAALQFR